MRLVLWCLLVMGLTVAQAQEGEREKIRILEQQREFARNRNIRQQIDSGAMLMDRGEYAAADEKFRFALGELKSIPSDLVFYFGKNSLFLNKYRQSVDWLTKYIQLKGTTGQYSVETADLLKQAEQALLNEQREVAKKAGEILSRDYDIDCGPSGKVTCPACSGNTVIIKRDPLHGEIYKTCPYCNKLGYLSCEDYNKLIRGQLNPNK